MAGVILITGTPGVGKSSVASKLSKKLDCEHIDISLLVKRKKLYKHMDRRRRTVIVDATRLKSEIARIVRTEDKTLVISTHYIGAYMPKNKVSQCFVLRVNPKTLEKRLRSRRWPVSKVRENVEAELVGVCLLEAIEYLGRRKVHEIDTTGSTANHITGEILDALGQGADRPSNPAHVDWLDSYDFGHRSN